MSSAPIVVRPEDVARAFLTPRAPAQRVPLAMPNSKSFRIPTSEGEIAIQRAGEGPIVLLLHGWEGQSSDLAGFVEPLLRSRHTVVAMDCQLMAIPADVRLPFLSRPEPCAQWEKCWVRSAP